MGLIIPHSHKIHGTPPAFACTICPAVFTADERHQYEHHVLAHPLEDLVPHSPALQNPVLFGDEGGDTEWRDYIKRMKIEDPDGAHRWMKTDAGKHSSGLGDG